MPLQPRESLAIGRGRCRADADDAVDPADRLYLQFPRPADRQYPCRTDQGRPRPFGYAAGTARRPRIRGLLCAARHSDRALRRQGGDEPGAADRARARDLVRSEEHTSELQSLMRNSYAVFCLKKKKKAAKKT